MSTTVLPFEPKQQLRCLFCRGKSCKNCGEFAYLKQANPAIPGLHSSWITENILAMQRPNDKILEKGVLQEFVKTSITVIFNLTEPGEHPFCGCQELNQSSGFSYTPEKLMAVGIKHFNYSWPDMTAPRLSLLKDIIIVACNELDRGNKIAVHCHAGYGRTGIVIACILIVRHSMTDVAAIAHVREKRKGSVQTNTQQAFVQKFYSEYQKMIQLYPVTSSTLKTISQSICDQAFSLTCKEYANHMYRNQHKILVLTTSTLISYFHQDNNTYDIFRAFTCLSSPTSPSSLSEEEELRLSKLKSQVNSNDWNDFSALCDNIIKNNMSPSTNKGIPSSLSSQLVVLCQLLLDFLDTRGDSIWDDDTISNVRYIINSNNINNGDKTCDDSITNDNEMMYHLLIISIEKSMEKCKIIMLSQLISMLIPIYDSKNEMTTLVIIRIAVSLCGHSSISTLITDRVLDPSLALSITNNISDNSDIAISFKVLSLLIDKKWKYDNTNRVGWRIVGTTLN